jgi:hypothetical protein
MEMKMFATLDKAKPDTGNTEGLIRKIKNNLKQTTIKNTRGLNLAAVKHTTVQVTRLPL